MGFIFWILAGLIAGWLTGKIMKGSGYGFFGDILLGIAGAIVGGFIARHLGLDPAGNSFTAPWSRLAARSSWWSLCA